jgi:hypothetical protein
VFPVGICLRDPRSQKRDLGHPSVSPFDIAQGTSFVNFSLRPESSGEHLPTSIAGVLRLRAIRPSVGERSAERFAQDDGLRYPRSDRPAVEIRGQILCQERVRFCTRHRFLNMIVVIALRTAEGDESSGEFHLRIRSS